MKRLMLMGALCLAGALAWADPQPYDSQAMAGIMHSNGATVGAVNKALEAGDWAAVAHGFIQFSQNAEKALTFLPPKGSADDWVAIWTRFEMTAFQGVGAAGDKDAAKAKAALDQLLSDRGQGHGEFKG